MANNESVPVANINGLATVATTGDYNDLANIPNVPIVSDVKTFSGRTSDITSSAFSLTLGGTLYRISYYIVDSTADLTAGAVTVNFAWTDSTGAQTFSSNPLALTTLGTKIQEEIFIATGGGNINYSTSHTGLFGSATYDLFITLEKIA